MTEYDSYWLQQKRSLVITFRTCAYPSNSTAVVLSRVLSSSSSFCSLALRSVISFKDESYAIVTSWTQQWQNMTRTGYKKKQLAITFRTCANSATSSAFVLSISSTSILNRLQVSTINSTSFIDSNGF